ncbi:LysM peptidoglycan-binding domain-containing protein [Ramlibacter sp. AN1133]|uniref:LysM peptidoglycan-binding domain-containing protein n=1 Tax=Ramlibacter sp. AN1133 TaxID=3133429 RepID=UPI0030BC1924
MVAIVSGIRPGLDLSSREVLGQAGLTGNASEGRNGQGVYVNVANGLLVVQNRDDLLVSRGDDAAALRTYNSAGQFNDDNADNWASGVVSLQLAGVLNAAGSTVSRVERDGSTAVYNFDAARGLYVTTEGAGAYDTISYVAAEAQFEWRDGSTGATQRFEGAGARRLLSCKDTSGNTLAYAYGANGFLSAVTTASGETTFYDYTGNNLSQVRTVVGTVTTTRVRYGYDLSNRLATVTVDLSPSDASIADGKIYQTTYTYDGTSKRIASIAQTDGSSLAFTYVDAGAGNFKVATVRDALNQATTFTYGIGFTTVTDAQGLVTRYDVDASGRLTKITAPTVAGTTPVQQFAYNANGDVVSVVDGQGRTVTFGYDANGNQILQRDQAGNTVTRTFDARNQLLTETVYVTPDPDGAGVAQPATPLTTRYIYDASGRNELRFTVSAEGRVTEHRYNGFGERVASITYTAALYPTAGLAAGAGLAEADLVTWAGAQNPAATQRVDLAYDGRGQLQSRTTFASVSATGAGVADGTQSVQSYVYDQAGLLLKTISGLNGATSYTYDAFGQLVQVKNLRNAVTDTWATTTRYFDRAGQETGTIDALGYLTQRTYDVFGNVVQSKEYATAMLAGYTLTTYVVPVASADDRTTTFAYDRLNRKTTASRLTVEYSLLANGTSTRGTVSTTYGYDALGNQTRVTDGDGKATFTYFDALGRVKAIAAPSRTSTVSGLALTPLTEFRRDAYGNVVVKLEYANGTASATQTVYTAAVADAVNDRSTLAIYDSFGRSTQSANANGANDFTSYDAYGHVAKRWQGVTGNDGITRTSFEVDAYDRLGQLIETRTPASTSVYSDLGGLSTVAQSTAGVVTTALEYNAFGELTRKGTQAGRQEYFDYDNAGRLWRTNSGDGVDRISLYDALGNATAEIRSSGSGRDNIDIKSFASAQAADANPYTRRVDVRYDALGRVTARTEAARQELQGGVTVLRQFTSAGVLASASTQRDENGMAVPGALNKLSLGWNSLAALGSGDVKVYLEYRTPVVTTLNESTTITSGGTLRSTTSAIFNGDASAGGLTMQWTEAGGTTDIGVSDVTRMVVYKKDVNGNWQVVVDQAPGYGPNELTVTAPPNATTAVTLQMRTAGTAGDLGWWTAGLVNFGNGLRFDARGLSVGNYEYRVTLAPPNEAARVTGTGTVAITQPPLNSIAAPITYGPAGAGVLAWANPGASYSQVLRYRVNGSTGAWSTLNVLPRNNGLYSGVDTAGMAGGTYQFELLWTVNGQGVPSAHATGTFTVVPPVPPQLIPAVNLPNITGLATTASTLSWTAANAILARYRVPGGTWINFVIDNSLQYLDESGASGVQRVMLTGIAPGTYEVQVFAGSPATAQATGSLTIYAQSPGYFQTVYEQVPVYTPVVAYYAPVYETRYGTRQVPSQVWVNDPPYAVFTGYDEAGTPQYSWVYPGHWETRYYTETYAYQVQVGSTPVYATDENGNIAYSVSYVTQAQQVWVPGTTPTPTIATTTPPYTAAYWTTLVAAQYGVSVTTPAGSKAISTTEGSVISQAAGANGDERWLRPTVLQKLDRWGNVLEITDPRATYWKTTYKYNFNNQLVVQTQPDVGGNISTSSPVTSIYYDRMGRQVAVKDANGFVNGQQFDAGGNLVQETHADGGVVTHAYNAFGEKVRTTDAMAKVVVFSYDKMGHVLRLVKGIVGVYQVNAANGLDPVVPRNITESWSYDQLGRKLTQTNGNGEVLSYTYDLRGNVVETQQPLGQAVRAAFDAQGRKIAEVDANGAASSWTYDYFGLLTGHVDLGGARYTYVYDNARQLTAQTSTRGQSIAYSYDAAGQLTTIRDAALDKTTTYAFDLSGRKIRERVVQQGVTYQDNHLAYDAQGNLRDIADARAHIVMEYDRVGNRTRVATFVDYQGTLGETSSSSDRYFKYDAMNRQVVVDAMDSLGNLGTQGHQITYDLNGNRTSDRYWGNMVIVSGGTQSITGYNEDGTAIYGTLATTYSATTGYTTEEYRYDNLNRMQGVVKDGTQIDVRYYDGADRVVQSGPAGALPLKYSEIINAGLAPDQMNGKETRINRYDANGRLLHQRVLKSDNTLKADVSWDAAEAYSDGVTTLRSDGYDAAGNVVSYVSKSYEGGAVSKFTTTSGRYEGYQGVVINGMSSRQNPGSTTQQYDANGYLVGITDSTQANNNRTFVNDANGRALFVNQGGNVQRQLIVNGEVLGLYGAGVDPNNPSSGLNNNPNFANVVDFDFGYAKISANHPTPSPGAYTVRTGDTLQSIAQGAYGDSSLWYRIAEANGLMSNSDLKVGQTLNIPNRVSTVSNNSSTFKPYDPTKIEGDKTPSLATPEAKKHGCGGLGQILMVVVAVVATIYTAGAMAGALGTVSAVGGSASTFTAGLAALGGGTATFGGVTVSIGAGAMGAGAAAVGAAAVGAAVGSVASQAVGIVTGMQDKFNWKGVALSALSAGVASGVGAAGIITGQTPAAVAARAVLGNVVTQGISVAAGLQKRFDWRGVAAAGAGAAVGQVVSGVVGTPGGGQLGEFMNRAISGFAGGVTAQVMRAGRVSVQQVAVDAFGNALGQSLAGGSGQQADNVPPPVSAIEGAEILGYSAEGPTDSMSGGNGLTFSQDIAIRQAALDPSGIRQMVSFPVGPQATDNPRVFRDFDPSGEWEDAQGPMGNGVLQVAGAGSVRVVRGNALGRGGVDVLDPVPSTVNGISVNRRADSLIQTAATLAGAGDLYRDIKLIGALMSEMEQQAMLDRLKGTLQQKLGMMRILPSEADLGAVRGMGSDGAPRWDRADLIDRYSDAVRKVELMRAGVIELDTRTMLIKSIGTEKLTPDVWVQENTRRYREAFAAGIETGQRLYDTGNLRRYPLDMPGQLQVGLYADDIARVALIQYNKSIGVPEGPGQLLSMNRWSYDPSGSGLYNRTDLLMDLGPNRNALILRTVIEGKSSLEAVRASEAQLRRAYDWVTPRVLTATPQGVLPYIPSTPKRLR